MAHRSSCPGPRGFGLNPGKVLGKWGGAGYPPPACHGGDRARAGWEPTTASPSWYYYLSSGHFGRESAFSIKPFQVLIKCAKKVQGCAFMQLISPDPQVSLEAGEEELRNK